MKIPGSAQDPLWYKDAIIYETHVKAFFDSNNDGIGDFGGLLQKLDYLQELGITCIWLLPFFPSPLRDDGYDISDYQNVHPSYGTIDDFKAFLKAAHDRNLQVLIELVINHTSDQHPWFQAARKAQPGSPEREFYVWSDTDQKYKHARIIFTDTEKSNWAWDPEAQAYYWHRFFSHQPDLNFDNPAVIQEVVRTMRFWLDMGVDGMRLDAIPYLVEREGTNCENLPETHAAIKQIRKELDERHSNRMLLAEANQWPVDVRPYFGDNDECHMAFHFPLMPRIFMALRLEDRHPVTEIMSQTPAIPDACQWGLFLRNHDELTLEMVTDEERDYMYLAYSADPRMRVNVGIRRRLAPLMDNNRRRIELMNSILFSFPGTPIIYYGDEIGMGDNIYLGDRNGVRTPMQWTADRNAGFSRANPAKLYSPLIMDPVYGYEAINVEGQQSDPSSLLHWMRNMIALRKLFKVFGRGTLEFLNPANRKVLAYLRRYQSDQILCVANLSRFAQPVELDLASMAGMVPVEMLGYTEFPTIGRAPYPLTLGPYSFYWFELQGTPQPIEVHSKTEVEDEDSLVLDGNWSSLFHGRSLELLEQVFLPRFLPSQRWFGGKAREIKITRVLDWTWFLEGSAPAALVLVEVAYQEGDPEIYFVPMAVLTGDRADELRRTKADAVIASLKRRDGPGVLYNALIDDANCQAFFQAIEHGCEFQGRSGVMRGVPTASLSELLSDATPPLAVMRFSAEQSNTSVLLADRMILKVFRRIEEGPNPDYEIGRHLTEKVHFDRVAKLAGGMEYVVPGRPVSTLAMVQQFIPNQGDGWKFLLEQLGLYYEDSVTVSPVPEEVTAPTGSILDLSAGDFPQAVRDRIGISLDAAAILGRRTGEMHLALAAADDDPAFRPESLTGSDLAELSSSLRKHAANVLETLKANVPKLPDEVMERAAMVLGERRRLLDRFRGLERLEIEAARIRIHGDYHLGQVLWVQNDYFILDFEGEPARPLAERRLKQSPLKDVAGMLRSFSYAAFAGLLAYTARRVEDYDRLELWASFWERWTSAAFLGAYRKTAAEASFLPADPVPFWRLLQAYLLDKALYELNYELNNRPSWVRIPLRGILSLVQQG